MSKPPITGTLTMEDRAVLPDGRHAVLVFGILAMPAEVAEAYCASRPTQTLIVGNEVCDLLTLTAVRGEQTDHDEVYKNYRVDQLLTSPIWRF